MSAVQIPADEKSEPESGKQEETASEEAVSDDAEAGKPDADAEEELYELKEGHVVEEGNSIPPEDNGPVEHAFDFGTPAMVFDNSEEVDKDEI